MDATSAPGSPAPVSLMGFRFKVSSYLVPYLWLARNTDHSQLYGLKSEKNVQFVCFKG